MTTIDPWAPPEQGEDEDYVDYLGRKADLYYESPPPAPPGFRLIECTAEPRHWPRYEFIDHDFYGSSCPDCGADLYHRELRELKRRYHRLQHPIRGRIASRGLGYLQLLGVIAGYGSRWGGDAGCKWCLTGIRIRGKRSYILGWPTWKWACLFQRRHWPGEEAYFGLCGKCLPCPDCGTTKWDHECTGTEAAA
ncbi:hypothetical protein [Nocardia xishanensis]|uniref:hypothetical protein n=1 Tax=Nocardia xishanensis TaxID=238964 RepID=UPI00082C757B|nr:hypothetical protein [Nocardia xishanensis]